MISERGTTSSYYYPKRETADDTPEVPERWIILQTTTIFSTEDDYLY